MGWTEEMFKKVYHTYLREMKKLLRTRGINTGPINGPVAPQLVALLDRDPDVLPEYTEGYLTKTVFDRRCEAYKGSLDFIGNTPTLGRDREEHRVTVGESAGRQPTPSEVRFAESNRQLEEEARAHTHHQNSVSRIPSQEPAHPSRESDTGSALVPDQNLYRGATPRAYPDLDDHLKVTTLRPDEQDPYKKLPPDDVKSERLDASLITHFTKNFDRDRKYNGDPYSLLDDALTTFFDICWHAQIQPTHFHAVFPRMLTGRAEILHALC